MVMPNIGAFIAWGFITALFIPDGWLPNEQLDLLAKIAGCLEDPEVLEKMKTTDDADWIMKILS